MYRRWNRRRFGRGNRISRGSYGGFTYLRFPSKRRAYTSRGGQESYLSHFSKLSRESQAEALLNIKETDAFRRRHNVSAFTIRDYVSNYVLKKKGNWSFSEVRAEWIRALRSGVNGRYNGELVPEVSFDEISEARAKKILNSARKINEAKRAQDYDFGAAFETSEDPNMYTGWGEHKDSPISSRPSSSSSSYRDPPSRRPKYGPDKRPPNWIEKPSEPLPHAGQRRKPDSDLRPSRGKEARLTVFAPRMAPHAQRRKAADDIDARQAKEPKKMIVWDMKNGKRFVDDLIETGRRTRPHLDESESKANFGPSRYYWLNYPYNRPADHDRFLQDERDHGASRWRKEGKIPANEPPLPKPYTNANGSRSSGTVSGNALSGPDLEKALAEGKEVEFDTDVPLASLPRGHRDYKPFKRNPNAGEEAQKYPYKKKEFFRWADSQPEGSTVDGSTLLAYAQDIPEWQRYETVLPHWITEYFKSKGLAEKAVF